MARSYPARARTVVRGGASPGVPPLIDDVVSPGDAPDFSVFSRDGKMLNRPLRCVDHSFQDPFICPAVHGLHGGPSHGSHIGVELLEGFTVNGVSSLETGRFISFFVEGNGEKNPLIHQIQGKSFGIYQLCIRIMGSVGIVFPHPALFSLFILNARNARKRVQVI